MSELSTTGKRVWEQSSSPPGFRRQGGFRWVVAVLSVGTATLAVVLLRQRFQPSPNALFFCAVIFSAWFGGVGPGLLSAFLSALAVKYFDTAPLHTLMLSVNEVPRLLAFLASGAFISWVSGQQKRAEEALRRLSDELEKKVQARTQELQRSNEDLQAEISERKHAEMELRRTQTYLSEGQRLSQTGSWAWDVKKRENSFWSKEHFRIYGFDPDVSNGNFRAARERIHPEDRPKFDEVLEQAIRQRRDFECYHRIVLPGGAVKHIHALGHPVMDGSGELIEFIGTAMDVTERKLSEALLSAEKHALELIAGGAPLLSVLNDLCNAIDEQSPGSISTVLTLDPGAQQLWPAAGPRAPEGWTRMITPLNVGPCAGSCGTAVYRREPVVVSDIATDPLWTEFRDAALSYGLRACWSRPVVSSIGAVMGTLAIYYRQPRSPDQRDLLLIERATHIAQIAIERDRTQESLRKAQANLAHVTRVTTMGELTASIAHEVNQPLTAVVNNASACLGLLPDRSGDLEEVHQALSEIIRDAERASAIIDRIRALAKKSAISIAPQDLRTILAEVLALTRHESGARGVVIRTELSDDLPLVQGDKVQLQQVFLNLVVNGMDAMAHLEENHRLLVITGRRGTHEGRPAVTITVRDSGVGLKAGEIDKLFEAFYTTKPQGLGMGLAICHSIVEAHGGRLWAESNEGPGATFSLCLPAFTEGKT
jgi:hypothetical protein